VFEADPVPELDGAQGPAVRDLLTRVLASRKWNVHRGLLFQTLEEAVRDFEVVCVDLDFAGADHVRREFRDLEAHLAGMARVRARSMSYFHAGHALAYAVADLAMGRWSAKSWWEYVYHLEGPNGDAEGRALVRLLSIRLMLTRHVLAAHRRGWPVVGGSIGLGMVALQRMPQMESMPEPDPGLIEWTARVLDRVGGTRFRDLKQALPVASWSLSERAPLCDRDARELYSALVDRYGVASKPQSRITPAIIAIVDRSIGSASP